MDWTDKVAFITGGATGIGFGIARAFSNAGIIDQHVHLAEMRLDLVGGAGEGGTIGDVELDE